MRIIKADGTFTTAEIAAGIDYARSRHAHITNISATVYDTYSIRSAVEAAAAADILTVVAAGNDGKADPIPAPLLDHVSANAAAHFLVVGAIDGDDQIVSWSARAGSAMNRYLVARGTSVLAAVADGDDQYGTGSGTSFSSPQVAGAAALVKGADPALSMADVAEILPRTADDLGDPGVDTIYGWGKLNPVRALEPVGTLAIPDGTRAASSAIPVSATSLRLGPAFGDALGKAAPLSNVVALDEYQRPYRVDVQTAVRSADLDSQLLEQMAAVAAGSEQVAVEVSGVRLLGSFQYRAVDAMDHADAWDDHQPDLLDHSLLLSGRAADMDWQILSGIAPSSRFGAGSDPEVQPLQWLLADGIRNGYLDLAGTGSHGLAMGAEFAGGARINAGYFPGRNPRSTEKQTVTAGVAEAIFHAGRLQLRLLASQVHEQAAVLGSAGSGALSTGQQALTDNVGISGQWRLGARTSMIAHFQLGRTTVDTQQSGLIRAWSPIVSQAWGVGAVRRGIFRPDDYAGFAYSQPLRVISGSVTVDAPTDRDLHRDLVREVTRVGVRPSGAERDLQFAYGYGLGNGTRLGASFAYRIEPGHIREADPDLAAMLQVGRRF